MARYHLHFKNFRQPLLDVTAEFFDSNPWSGTTDEIHAKFTDWLQGAAGAYGIDPPKLIVMSEEQMFIAGLNGWQPGERDMVTPNYSVLTMFWLFRHHLHRNGVQPYGSNCEWDARGWSCSLFYRFRPITFRRAVRSNRVMFDITPEDLLTTETMNRVRELRLAGRMADAEALYMGEEPASLTESEQEAFEAIAASVGAVSDDTGEDTEGETDG